MDCAYDGPDQLTRELGEFVATVRSGGPIRVPGEHGREALALACRILDSLRGHAWEGRADGPTGPSRLVLASGGCEPPGNSSPGGSHPPLAERDPDVAA
ncbi:MAG: hypothetical protein HYS12_26170 [Planctomycetes bacterium]|nr:hypothetical protein [Planctomycetota bacterium]